MSTIIQTTPPPPRFSASLNSLPILGSGTVLMTRDDVLTLRLNELSFEIRFVDMDGDTPEVQSSQISPTMVSVSLKNFKNPLGTALGPVQVGTLHHRPLILGLFVLANGDRNRVVHYSLYEGR